jgi:hypothetical protein
VSAPAARRGGPRGPRQPPGPRSGAGPRRAAHGVAPALQARAAQFEETAATAPVSSRQAAAAGSSDAAAAADAPDVRPRELSGLAALLYDLDQLLRDPTVTRALKRFASKLTGPFRDFAAAVRRLLGVRIPRWLLLGLLGLLLPLALLALLTSGDDDRESAQVAGASLPGIGMPALSELQSRPKPVRVALVLDRTYDAPALRRELRTLGTWLDEHHAAGTRVTIIDAQAARASAPLRPAQLAAGGALRAQDSTTAAVRSALGGPPERRLLVTLGSPAPQARAARTLNIATRPGASGAVTGSGERSRAAIDDRRPNALAASIARGIMGVSGQREPG